MARKGGKKEKRTRENRSALCALLHSFALLFVALCGGDLRSFALICVFLRPTAFRTTMFGNCPNHL